ncbi:hypothetical protein ACA910_010151 [Epithemia clementina (nom. ined.)]
MGMDQHKHAGFAYIDDDGTPIVIKNHLSPSSSQTGGDDMLVEVTSSLQTGGDEMLVEVSIEEGYTAQTGGEPCKPTQPAPSE